MASGVGELENALLVPFNYLHRPFALVRWQHRRPRGIPDQ
jgi:hypothetical protein